MKDDMAAPGWCVTEGAALGSFPEALIVALQAMTAHAARLKAERDAARAALAAYERQTVCPLRPGDARVGAGGARVERGDQAATGQVGAAGGADVPAVSGTEAGMSCDVCLSMDVDEPYDDYSRSMGVSETDRECYECGDPISVGVTHEIARGDDADGEAHEHHTCVACADIAESLSCDGTRCHGGLWDAVEWLADEETIGIGCLNKLKTAAGKAKLQQFIASLL